MQGRWTNWRRPRVFFLLVLTAMLGLGLVRLRWDVEVLNLLPADLPVVQGLKTYQRQFANADELVITVSSPTAEMSEEAAAGLARYLRRHSNVVAQAHWQLPWQENPGLAGEFLAYLWLNQPPDVFRSLADRLSPGQVANVLAETQTELASSLSPKELAQLSYDPFQLFRLPAAFPDAPGAALDEETLFASSDGAFRLIFVRSTQPLDNYRGSIEWLETIQHHARQWQHSEPRWAELALGFTGRPAFVAEIAGGMEQDLAGPSSGTLVIIALLFYAVYRRWKPLLWLAFLLALILAGTIALAGLAFGALNVISLGFASILLGLAEDFGIIQYQEKLSHPELPTHEVRRLVAPGILWSAITTAAAFFLLNLSDLPGLAQLGSLVGMGILFAAAIMLLFFLAPLGASTAAVPASAGPPQVYRPLLRPAQVTWLSFGVLAATAGIILWTPPVFDRSPNALRPSKSGAQQAMAEIQRRVGRGQEALWLVVQGRDEVEVSEKLRAIEGQLAKAKPGWIKRGTLPVSIWPNSHHQTLNRPLARQLADRASFLEASAFEAGYAQESMGLFREVVKTWRQAAASERVFWPGNAASRWTLEKISAITPDGYYALGLIYPAMNTYRLDLREIDAFLQRLPSGVWLTGWDLLGARIAALALAELPRILIPIALVVLVALWLAFKDLRSVFLCLGALVWSGAILAALSSLFHFSWNMMNLMAIPLLLGMGVDYAIHIILAARRYKGDYEKIRLNVGRALLLAGATTIVGFGSLAFSNNAGLASLGKICALGLACSLWTSVFILPAWWLRTHPKVKSPPTA